MKKIALFLVLAYGFLFSIILYTIGLPEIIISLTIIAVEAGLLLVPVSIECKKPVSRNMVFLPTLLCGTLAIILFGTTILSFAEYLRPFPELSGIFIIIFLASSFRWSILFLKISENKDMPTKDIITGQCALLFKAALVLLSLIILSNIFFINNDPPSAEGFPFSIMMAGSIKFVGISLILTVMLLSSGPGIYFLCTKGWKKLHPNHSESIEEP